MASLRAGARLLTPTLATVRAIPNGISPTGITVPAEARGGGTTRPGGSSRPAYGALDQGPVLP
jgi:hypothetical protein